jgi:outer membrane protein TolC
MFIGMNSNNRGKMVKKVRFCTLASIVLLFGAAAHAADPLTLSEALKATSGGTAAELTRVVLSYGRLQYLKTQNKSKFELRPQLGLLAFSNPLLLATNLGAGLLWHRFQAPNSFALQSAEYDVLTSEVAYARRRSDVQVETARVFFELLELQQSEQGARELQRAWRTGTERVAELLRASRITVQDTVAFDVALVELEMDVAELEGRRKAKAVDLARLVGVDREMGTLRVTDQGLAGTWDNGLSRDALIVLAVERREELKVLRRRLAATPEPPPNRRVRFDSFGANYAHIGQNNFDVLGYNGKDLLFGGHTARTDLGIAISLRSNGERQAAAAITAARRKVLEIELKDAEDSIRAEVEKLWLLVVAGQQKLELSSRKLALHQKALAALKARMDHGLGSLPSLLAGELDALRQQAQYESALAQQRTRTFHLLAATGEEFKSSQQSSPAPSGLE